MGKTLTRISVAGAAVAAVLGGTVTTAQAAEAGVLDTDIVISLPDGRGKMTYIDDGDMFQVCDTRADGHGVEGTVIDDMGRRKLTVDDGGDAGCDKGGWNVPNTPLDYYQMTLMWNGGGPTVYSRKFNE
ncbi:hypothetical protein ACFU98_05165 [Streptomyces sp. NPDC057575]|uniref:hypothetical protein n=1 Tax=unclassified Streptomyces TaxID=2593676 RepID=UPI0036941629